MHHADRNVTTEQKKGIPNPIAEYKLSMRFRRGSGVHTQSSAPYRAKYGLFQTEQFHAAKLKRSTTFSTMNLTAAKNTVNISVPTCIQNGECLCRGMYCCSAHFESMSNVEILLQNAPLHRPPPNSVCHQDQTHIYKSKFRNAKYSSTWLTETFLGSTSSDFPNNHAVYFFFGDFFVPMSLASATC
jgi:hypothetical protein